MLLHSGIVLMLIAMTKQVAGTDCSDALGMENGKIKDSQINVSSVWSSAYGELARLNKNIPRWGAWCFDPRDLKAVTQMEYNEYIKIDLLNVTKVTKVATQGRGSTTAREFTKKYKISYSDDNSKWIYYKDKDSLANLTKLFDGNTDVSTVVSHILDPVIVTRYIRIHPGYFVHVACLRLELYGCKVTRGSTPTNTPSLHQVIETPSTTSLSTDFSQAPSTTSLNTESHECSNLLPILIGLVSLFCLIALVILALLLKWKLFNSKQPNVLLEMESKPFNPPNPADNNVPTTATTSATQTSNNDFEEVPPNEGGYEYPFAGRDAIPDPSYTELGERTDDGHFYQKLIKP